MRLNQAIPTKICIWDVRFEADNAYGHGTHICGPVTTRIRLITVEKDKEFEPDKFLFRVCMPGDSGEGALY